MQPLSLIDRCTYRMVIIAPEVLELIHHYRQVSTDDCESGGILIGIARGIHLEVTAATPPQISDQRSRMRFRRFEAGHKEILLKRWRASEGMENYVGEWHTHPEQDANPSPLDLREWSRASKRLKEPLLVIIGGTVSNFYAFADNQKCQRLQDIV